MEGKTKTEVQVVAVIGVSQALRCNDSGGMGEVTLVILRDEDGCNREANSCLIDTTGNCIVGGITGRVDRAVIKRRERCTRSGSVVSSSDIWKVRKRIGPVRNAIQASLPVLVLRSRFVRDRRLRSVPVTVWE
ncbi:hypothetical protein KKA02_00180 [Patescibacteria group bacterium]|nr:hypothetical protein [Patescibacteria group bacterium]